MSNYVFANSDHSMVIRDGSSWIVWNSQQNRPLHLDSFVGDQWKADGSPVPAAHVAPPVSTVDVVKFADTRLAAGYADAITGKTWQCDESSIIKWTSLSAAAGIAIALNTQPVPTFTLIAADNSLVTLTAPQVYALFPGRVMTWVSATVLFARTMKDDILAGTPPADFTAGWP